MLIGLTAYLLRPKRGSEVAQIWPEPATLDLKDSSGVRGDAKALEKAVPVLPRRKLELTVVLAVWKRSWNVSVQACGCRRARPDER